MSSTPDRPRAGQQRRFTAVEALVVLTLLLTVMLFLGRFLYEVLARYRTIAAVRHITAMTLATRLQAAEANRIAVLFLDMKNRRIVGWIERGTPNLRQDPEEPATQEYELPSFLVFRRALAGAANEPDAVGFDTYNGDRTLVDRVIFQPDGTLVRPEAENSRAPLKAKVTRNVPFLSVDCVDPSDCRGIFISDGYGPGWGRPRNVFRVSVDDFTSLGRVSVLKWLPASEGGNPGEWDFVPPPWHWYPLSYAR